MPIRRARHALVLFLGIGLGCARTPTSPDPSSGPPGQPFSPPQAVLSISPGPAQAPLGAEGYTPFVFDGSASTGDGLTYRIDFGDGESATSVVAAHIVGTSGARTARLTVTDRQGRTAVAERPYFVAKVETNYPFTFWQGNLGQGPARAVRLTLSREGGIISGHVRFMGAGNGIPINGHLTGDRDLRFRSDDGQIEMTGTLQWEEDADINFSQVRVEMRLTIRGGPADGATVILSSVDTY